MQCPSLFVQQNTSSHYNSQSKPKAVKQPHPCQDLPSSKTRVFHTTFNQDSKHQKHRTFPKMLYNMKYTSVVILGFLNAFALAVPITTGELDSFQHLVDESTANRLHVAQMRTSRRALKNASHSLILRSLHRWQSLKPRLRPPLPPSLLLWQRLFWRLWGARVVLKTTEAGGRRRARTG